MQGVCWWLSLCYSRRGEHRSHLHPALRLPHTPIPPSASRSIPVPVGSQSSSFCVCLPLHLPGVLQLLGMFLQFGRCSSVWGIPNCRTLRFTDFLRSQPCISSTWAFHRSHSVSIEWGKSGLHVRYGGRVLPGPSQGMGEQRGVPKLQDLIPKQQDAVGMLSTRA